LWGNHVLPSVTLLNLKSDCNDDRYVSLPRASFQQIGLDTFTQYLMASVSVCSCFPYFVTDKGEIRYTFSSTAVLPFWVSWNSVQWTPHLSYGCEQKFALIVYVYLEIYFLPSKGDFRQNLLIDCKFRENWRSESLSP